MTGTTTQTKPASASYWTSDAVHARNRKRYAAERRFRWYGIAALAFATGFLVILFTTIIGTGWTAFMQSKFKLDVTFSQDVIAPGRQRPTSRHCGWSTGTSWPVRHSIRPSASMPASASSDAPPTSFCRAVSMFSCVTWSWPTPV
jgi:hypothetical protein